MSIAKQTRQAVLLSGASIILAGIMLLSLRVLHPSWPSDQLDALYARTIRVTQGTHSTIKEYY